MDVSQVASGMEQRTSCATRLALLHCLLAERVPKVLCEYFIYLHAHDALNIHTKSAIEIENPCRHGGLVKSRKIGDVESRVIMNAAKRLLSANKLLI
jgi:hypothetical protein